MKKITFLFALLCASVMGFAVQYCELPTGHLGNADFGDPSGRVLLTLQKDGNNVIVKLKNNTANGNPQTGLNYMWVNATGATNNDAKYGSHSTANTEEISVTVEFSEDKDSYTFNNIHWAYEGFGGEWAIDGLTVAASELCAAAACADNENPTISAVATSDITYNSAVLTVTASDNIGVTGYIVKNGASQIASSATSPITITGLTAATTYDNIKVIAKDACNNESAEFAVSSFTTEAFTYCSFATGHLGQANFGDANGRILLTLTKLSASSVGVTVEPNNGGADVFDFVEVILGGVSHTLGAVGGSAPTNTEIVFDGLASLDFSINVLWHNHNWADAGGRWTTQSFSVTEAELCPGPINSEYCNYEDSQTIKGGKNIALTWETDGSGNVIITMQPGTGTTSCSFRNGGFEGGINAFVVSDDNFATTTPASDYFTAVQVYSGNTYTLTKTADLPANAKIKHVGSGHALAWVLDGNNEYCFPDFIYTYGGTCNQLDAPTNVNVDANNIITFDAVTGASSYTAYVSLSGVQKYSQVVVSGDELTFTPLVDGDYDVTVVASGIGKTDSDPSSAFVWSLTAAPIVLGNSEYCDYLFGTGNQQAALTWETDGNGNIVITISDAIDGTNDPAHFRGNGMALGNFQVGAGKEPASNYFNHACGGSNQVTLSLKDPAVAPVQGEKIYFTNKVVEYTTKQNTNAYSNFTFEYTYGTVCSGKAVSATPNNNTMGMAVVQKAGVDVTSVDEGDEVSFIATVADAELYRFVNWTKGGVEVSTSATYVTTITESTNLIANFDYIRNTYCHTEINSVQNKKLYLTLGAIGGGQYQIKIEGSAEAQLTALNNANYTINWVTTDIVDGDKNMSGQDVPFNNARWAFDASGYGSATAVFGISEGKTWEDIYVWNHAIYFSSPSGEIGYTGFPNRYHIAWNETCTDAEAPVFAKAEGAVQDATSVRLTIQASDNWEGMLTYTIARAGAEPIISNHASGEEFTQDVTGLTTGTEYDFTVTVSDGVNNANTHILVTPVGDNTPPVWNSASLVSYGCYSAVISVDASDAFGIASIYVVELDADYVPAEGKITITGLTPNTDYSFTLKAKDPAGNSSDPSDAIEFKTKSDVPTSAAPTPTWPTNQVMSIYSNAYDFAPASLNSYNEGWYLPPTMAEENVGGDNYLRYHTNMSGVVGWQFGQISVALMEYIHVDIWPSVDGTITMGPTSADPTQVASVTLNVVAGQWNSFNISIAELQAANASFDVTKVFQNQFTGYSAQTTFSVDNVFFYRTTPPPTDEAAPTDVTVNSAVASFTTVTIKAQANDDSGVVHFKVLNGSDVLVADVEAVSGAEATLNVTGLSHSTAYTLSLIAFDAAGHEAAPVAVPVTTLAVPAAAPQPTHDELAVLSVYSNEYTPAVAASFNKSNWGSAPVAYEADYLLYNMSSNVIVWGNNDGNAGHGNIDGLSGKTHETTPGLDVSEMKYIHFDVWCDKANQLNTVNINDVAVPIPTTRTVAGEWVSFDVDITGVALADKQNVRWLKFHPFSTTECHAAIDNVYFYKDPEYTRDDSWMAPGELGTVCYPQGLLLAGATMYKMAGTDANGKFVFDEVTELEPGVPYLFEATADVIHFYATEATPATEAGESNGMKGTFSEITIPQNSPNIYYFSGQKFYAVTARQTALTVPANRAYVDLTEPHPAMAPKPGIRRITFDVQGANTTTGVDNFDASETPVKVMIDGQLYILRGEKMYNANGQIVK